MRAYVHTPTNAHMHTTISYYPSDLNPSRMPSALGLKINTHIESGCIYSPHASKKGSY